MARTRNNCITEGELFAALARRSNSLPEDTVREVYYGLVKVIVDQFREGRDVNLPGLGRLHLTDARSSRSHNVATREEYVRHLRQVVFSSCKELKLYIAAMHVKERIRD